MGVRWATWLILGALSAPAVAGAEDSLTLANLSRGDRVRLRLSSGGKTVRGTLDASGPDELAVKTDRWVPVETRRPKLALTLAPTKGGFRADLSLQF